MPSLYFKNPNDVNTTSFQPDLPVITSIPFTTSPTFTPTYAAQVKRWVQVISELGTTKGLAVTILGEEPYKAQQQIVERIGQAEKDVGPLWQNRAAVFLAYLEEHRKIAKSARPSADRIGSGQYSSQDLTQLLGTFFNNISPDLLGDVAASHMRTRAKAYVQDGTLDDELTSMLTLLDARHARLPEYVSLRTELESLNKSASPLSAIEAAVESYRQNPKSNPKVKVLGKEVDVSERLHALGVNSMILVEEIVEGEIKDAPLSVVRFTPGRSYDLPQGSYLLPVEGLGRVITLFDKLIRDIFIKALVNEKPRLQQLLNEAFKKRDPDYSILMRAAFADDHKPTLALYPDFRVDIASPELRTELITTFRSQVNEISDLINRNAPENPPLHFQDFLKLQSGLMELLPMPLYSMAAVSSQFADIRTSMQRIGAYKPEARVHLMSYQSNERKTQKDFRATIASVTAVNKSTPKQAMDLFGKRVEFLKGLELIPAQA